MDCIVLKKAMSLKDYKRHEKACQYLFGKNNFRMTLSGCFMCNDGEPAWLHNSKIVKIGIKYIHVQEKLESSSILKILYPLECEAVFKIWKPPIW